MMAAVHPFLLTARLGRWRWYWALLGTVLVFALVLAFVGVGQELQTALANALGREDQIDNLDLRPGYIDSFVGFALFGAAFMLATALVLRAVHGQDPRLALSPSGHFDWRHFGKAALAYLAVLLIATALMLVVRPDHLKVLPRTLDHLPWLLLAAVVILPQAFGEDYLFKGYLARTWGAVVPLRGVVIVAIAVLFSAIHSVNDDVRADLIFNMIQFIFGEIVVIALFVRTGSLALTTGLHWMNNVWALCIVSTDPGHPDTLSLLRWTDRIVLSGGTKLTDPWSWAMTLIGYGLLVVLLVWSRSPLAIARYVPTPDPAPGAPTAPSITTGALSTDQRG